MRSNHEQAGIQIIAQSENFWESLPELFVSEVADFGSVVLVEGACGAGLEFVMACLNCPVSKLLRNWRGIAVNKNSFSSMCETNGYKMGQIQAHWPVFNSTLASLCLGFDHLKGEGFTTTGTA